MEQPTNQLSFLSRIAPVVSLLVLAPWIGEYLLGNVPLSALVAIPFLIPLYGGGALLIREVARRTGRGWPTILTLAVAYGIIEAGLVDQSLFNTTFEGVQNTETTFVPVLGISAYNALSFIIGHAVWSISIPIAIVEIWTPRRRHTPWLGMKGLVATALLYLFGCWIIFQDVRANEQFLAAPVQLLAASVVAVTLVVAAFFFKKRQEVVHSLRTAPHPLLLGGSAFVLINAFFVRPENWAGVVMGIVLLAILAYLVLRCSRRAGWSTWHAYALVAAILPTYMYAGFILTSIIRPADKLAWIGNILFALAAAILLAATAWRIRNTEEMEILPPVN